MHWVEHDPAAIHHCLLARGITAPHPRMIARWLAREGLSKPGTLAVYAASERLVLP